MTPLADLIVPLRVLIDDHDSEASLVEDASLIAGLRLVIQGGQVKGYALTEDRLGITPALTEPTPWLLALVKTALVFVLPRGESYAVRQRGGVSESFGGKKDLIAYLLREEYRLGGGGRIVSWQECRSWAASVHGLSRWELRVTAYCRAHNCQ